MSLGSFIVSYFPPGFLLAVLLFFLKHLFFGTAGTTPFLPADFFDQMLLFGFDVVNLRLYSVAEIAARNIPVQLARPLLLALDLDSGRNVLEIDA